MDKTGWIYVIYGLGRVTVRKHARENFDKYSYPDLSLG